MNFREEVLNEEILWVQQLDNPIFFESEYKGKKLLLRLNDFPEEPLYSVFIGEELFDIEDKPCNWTLKYQEDR